MHDPRHLDALAAVLRTGSFEAAAFRLSVTPSAISQRIRALEDAVGTVLVVRSQPAVATEVGQRLLRHAEEVARLEADLARDIGVARAERPLRIAVNADSLETWVIPALAAVEDQIFEVVIDDQDHSAELLRKGEVAAAITAQPEPVQGCDAFPLGALRYIATATPEFAARWFAEGLTPAALSRAPALIFNEKDALQLRWAERLAGRRVTLTGHHLPSTTAFVAAARAGLGWGMNPEVLVAGDLRTGRLLALGNGLPLDTPLTWQASRTGRSLLTPVTDAIRAAAKKVLIPPGEPS